MSTYTIYLTYKSATPGPGTHSREMQPCPHPHPVCGCSERLCSQKPPVRVSKALEWVGGRRTTQVVDDYWEITHQLLLSTTPMVRFTHPGKWNMSLQRLQPARSCLYSIVKELKLIVVASSWEMLGGVNYSGTKRILGGDRKVQEIRSCRISSVIQDCKPTYSFTLLLSNTHFEDKACLIQKLQSPYRFFHHSEC